jgi:hypothetical protein
LPILVVVATVIGLVVPLAVIAILGRRVR